MILRAGFAVALVLLMEAHQPDIGFGRPTSVLSVADTAAPSRCNQNDASSCRELHPVETFYERLVAAANRVRDDLDAEHVRAHSSNPAI